MSAVMSAGTERQAFLICSPSIGRPSTCAILPCYVVGTNGESLFRFNYGEGSDSETLRGVIVMVIVCQRHSRVTCHRCYAYTRVRCGCRRLGVTRQVTPRHTT